MGNGRGNESMHPSSSWGLTVAHFDELRRRERLEEIYAEEKRKREEIKRNIPLWLIPSLTSEPDEELKNKLAHNNIDIAFRSQDVTRNHYYYGPLFKKMFENLNFPPTTRSIRNSAAPPAENKILFKQFNLLCTNWTKPYKLYQFSDDFEVPKDRVDWLLNDSNSIDAVRIVQLRLKQLGLESAKSDFLLPTLESLGLGLLHTEEKSDFVLGYSVMRFVQGTVYSC